ncbi:hypothetical protein BV25DRAFT_180229 [Artomyces pyxidatus]|uniref:Uncharacterized protein n=1 Tax=Artomyces pyxidatus TaxID=48021 RepID=A0ACB8SGH9_9AGAM|nr:hypothetical protein BV25DRAFT_180229 [Artomyces pyxidatus]
MRHLRVSPSSVIISSGTPRSARQSSHPSTEETGAIDALGDGILRDPSVVIGYLRACGAASPCIYAMWVWVAACAVELRCLSHDATRHFFFRTSLVLRFDNELRSCSTAVSAAQSSRNPPVQNNFRGLLPSSSPYTLPITAVIGPLPFDYKRLPRAVSPSRCFDDRFIPPRGVERGKRGAHTYAVEDLEHSWNKGTRPAGSNSGRDSYNFRPFLVSLPCHEYGPSVLALSLWSHYVPPSYATLGTVHHFAQTVIVYFKGLGAAPSTTPPICGTQTRHVASFTTTTSSAQRLIVV